MKKEQANEVKSVIKEKTGKGYTMTYSAKSETLHVGIGSYPDSLREKESTSIAELEIERDGLIKELRMFYPQYVIEKNNKRYQGFINDICITVK